MREKLKVSDLNCTEDQLNVLIAERSFYEFLQQAWNVVETDPFVPNWHIKAVCDHLQAVSEGRMRNLVINIPPRFTKSLAASVLWPAWEWGPFNRPHTRLLCMSYAADLSLRDSHKCRMVIQSEWYQKRWGDRFQLLGDQNAKERYSNTKNGHRVASSIGGIGTGEGGSRLLIDDPHNIKDVDSESSRRSVVDWWDGVMPTRLNDPKKSSTVIIMQRSHFADLAGHIKGKYPHLYEWLVLPNEFEPATRCTTSLPFVDPRREEGELLWPERFGKAETDGLKLRLGAYAYAGQFQQRPAPLEGGIFKRHWLRYYDRPPEHFDTVAQSWDFAFTNSKNSSYVAGQVWGIKGADRYLLDRVHERLSFTECLKAMRSTTERWPQSGWKFVENKANGPAIIDSLRQEISGIIPCAVDGSKEARAFSVSPIVESGNVFLPTPTRCPWILEFVEELCTFPASPNNDEVDAFSQAMNEIRKRAHNISLPPLESITRESYWKNS